MSQIILYNYFRSSTSYRVRIALHYKELSFEYRPVHLLNNGGEQHSPEFRKLNPLGEVPAIIHDGKIISQSMAIIEYLEEVFPKNPLLPLGDPLLRAQIRQFCENINAFMHPVNNLKILQYLEQKHGYTLEQKEYWVQHWLTQGFQSLEKMVSSHKGPYCFGHKMTMADVFLIPQIFSAKRFNVDLKPFPRLLEIDGHCNQLDIFRKAHPLQQIDSPK